MPIPAAPTLLAEPASAAVSAPTSDRSDDAPDPLRSRDLPRTVMAAAPRALKNDGDVDDDDHQQHHRVILDVIVVGSVFISWLCFSKASLDEVRLLLHELTEQKRRL